MGVSIKQRSAPAGGDAPPPKKKPKPPVGVRGKSLGVRAGAYGRLYELGSERMAIIDTKLAQGESFTAIATFLRDTWKVMLDVKHISVVQTIKRYHDHVWAPRKAQAEEKAKSLPVKTTGNTRKVTAFTLMQQRLDVQAELENLALLQKKRIDKMVEVETKMNGMVSDAVTKLISPYLSTLQSVANLQLETGVIRRAPKVVAATVDVYADGKQIPEFVQHMQDRNNERKGVALLVEALDEALMNLDALEGDFSYVDGSDVAGDPAGDP